VARRIESYENENRVAGVGSVGDRLELADCGWGAAPAGLKDFDAYVARTLTEFEVPGIAVAIVEDGEVVMAAGFGVRKLGEPARVDDQTVFAIASNTKAFTAAALVILVDEGKAELGRSRRGPGCRGFRWRIRS